MTIESLTTRHKYSQEVGLSNAFKSDASFEGEVILGNADVVLHEARYIRVEFQTSVPESERNFAHPYFTVSSRVWVTDDRGDKKYLCKGARRTGIKFRSASTRKFRTFMFVLPRALGFCDEMQDISTVVMDTKVHAMFCKEKKGCGIAGVDIGILTDTDHILHIADSKINVYIWRTHILRRIINNVGVRHLFVLTSWVWLVSCVFAFMLFFVAWKISVVGNRFITSTVELEKR